jgi:hypothetical protein
MNTSPAAAGPSGARGAVDRLRRLLPALWLGLLACVAFVAAPAPFAVLSAADAGRVNGRIFAQEAWLSVAVALLLLMLERQRAARRAQAGLGSVFSTEMILLLVTLMCTFGGYFAVQPLLPAARAGSAALSFGQLHLISVALFALKGGLVAVLAWRSTSSR